METGFNPEVRAELRALYEACKTDRPLSIKRYDPGDILELEIEGVFPKVPGFAKLKIDGFVGGGFAGQVYRTELIELRLQGEGIEGLDVGNYYAVKIIKPSSSFSFFLRNFLYLLAFQGAFSPQVNPSALRAIVIWQKLIRRGASIYFGSEECVVDVYAIFFDKNLSSFGTLNEWVEGRLWKFELDDNIFNRWKFCHKESPPPDINSPEYVHKKIFMDKLVRLFNDMGAFELARQYEWWTTKSQPNVLKRVDTNSEPEKGLIAIDFFAGLALIAFLPMSPVDLKLIFKGLMRGSLVQFDRGNLKILERFCNEHGEYFKDIHPLIEELKVVDEEYRSSLLDVTHHHFRLITRPNLRRSIKKGTLTAWENLGYIDKEHKGKLDKSSLLYFLLLIVSILPITGKFILKIWGMTDYRKRWIKCFTSWNYLSRMLKAKRIERLIQWHQQGAISEERVIKTVDRPVRFLLELIFLSLLPPKWHRFIAEPSYALESIVAGAKYAYKLLTKPKFREEWLLEQVRAGEKEGTLSKEEVALITKQVKDPFIQKYLKSLAVHICTLPVTQIVSVIVALYGFFAFGKTWQESLAYAAGILAVFQVLPVSPGSLVRGFYVLFLMVKERDFKNYWLAALVSFWHYIGYLGFPIQMVAKYPALARFMAGGWARNMVGKIPIFGEKGGLVEHMVFDLFFNLPLTIRRKLKRK